MANALTDRAASRVVMCDGGMGTQLMAAGLTTGGCGVLWNVHHPERIEQIHQRYCDAGCELITTNTFQGSSTALAMHSLSDRTAELNRAAAAAARRVADRVGGDDRPLVMADIGPFGGFLEPLGDTSPEQLQAIFTEQLEAMKEGGADGVIIETMSDVAELSIAVKTARAMGDWPIVATFAFEKGGDGTFHTMMGTSPADAMEAAIEAGADIVGTNCGTSLSLDDYVELARQLVAAAGDTPVIVQPNAGAPVMVEGESVHPAEPDEMAGLVPRLVEAGVRVIGGCCGTTPEHLRAMAAAR
jgi:5-methyltetrahydrofolate--homocysteine methyltransferase